MSGAQAAVDFAASLKAATRELHAQAERSGFIAAMLRGQASRAGYIRWLRNLLPAYEALEAGLDANRDRPGLAALAWPALYRAPAMRRDLRHLAGTDWERGALFPAAARYEARIAHAAETAPVLLVAHAYVRYLGDLHGGQIIRRILAESMGLGAEGLEFYEFDEIGDLPGFRHQFRAVIAAAAAGGDDASFIAEAQAAFGFNVALSIAIGDNVAA